MARGQRQLDERGAAAGTGLNPQRSAQQRDSLPRHGERCHRVGAARRAGPHERHRPRAEPHAHVDARLGRVLQDGEQVLGNPVGRKLNASRQSARTALDATITRYYQSHHAGVLAGELLINLASVVLLWFVGGLFAIIRQRDEHGFLAPVVLGSAVVAVALGIVSDIAGTVAGLLAAQHQLADPSLTRALLELSDGVHLAFFPLVALTATLAAAIFQGAIGARWLGWLSGLSSTACLVSAVLGSLGTNRPVPPVGLLGFFITVIALSVGMLRHRSGASAAMLESRPATAAHQ
jgi:hypothetical protein